MTEPTIREQIIEILKKNDGVIRDPEGFAVRAFYDGIDAVKTSISTEVKRMELDGMIEREMPNEKRTTVIRLVSEEPVELAPVEYEDYVREEPESVEERVTGAVELILDIVRDETHHAILEWEAQVDRLEWEVARRDHTLDSYRKQVAKLEAENQELRQTLRQSESDLKDAKARVEQLKGQLKEAKAKPLPAPPKPIRPDVRELMRKDKRHGDWNISIHAERWMKEMQVSWPEVYQVLVEPEVDYVSGPEYGEHARVAQRGDLAVAYNEQMGDVITVLWRKDVQWTREEFKQYRKGEGS